MFLFSLGAMAAIILGSTPTSEASPSAYALVVGSRNGGSGQSPLQYAGKDAGRFGELLVELGRYAKNHVRVLQDPTREQLLSELHQVEADVRKRQMQGEHTLLLFYYSGHARASGLSLGPEELSLTDLRQELVSAPSDLTIAILDACQSGEFSRVKGVEAAPDFSINSVSQLNTRGLAVMASSTGSELSQESDRLAGSYFTHHLIMGMRGAADIDGDGRVTLTEAYRYAYARTLIETAATSVGSQHATLETSLQGKGEVPLTYPKEASASLSLAPELRGKVLVSIGESIVGELDKAEGNPIRLGLPPGHYTVIVRQSDTRYECRTDLIDRRETPLALGSCAKTSVSASLKKGEVPGWHFGAQLFALLASSPDFFSAAGGASATYYFDKLIDDRTHPFGLLTFLQRPNSLEVLPNVFWTSAGGVSSKFGGFLVANVYPWQRTGLAFGIGGDFDAASSFQVSVGINHYLSSTLRLDVSYYGYRAQSATDTISMSGASSFSHYDDFSFGATALGAHQRLLTEFSATLGRIRQLSADSSRNGMHVRIRTRAEYFLSRHISGGLEASVERRSWIDTASGPEIGPGGTLAPSLNFYIADNLLLSARYSLTYVWLSFGRGLLPNVLNLGIACRF